MASFLPPNWPNFDHFHQKWHILTKFTALITFLNRYLSINTNEKILGIKLTTFLKFLHITSFWPPKSPNFDDFDQNWPILTKIRSFWGKIMSYVKIVINGLNLVKIGHFWWKWSKSGHFWGQKGATGQNVGKVVINFL